MCLQPSERFVPLGGHEVEVILRLQQRLRIQLEQAQASGHLAADNPDAFQHLQMFRDRLPGDRVAIR